MLAENWKFKPKLGYKKPPGANRTAKMRKWKNQVKEPSL